MNIGELKQLIADYELTDDTPVAIMDEGNRVEQEWNLVADVHPATMDGEDDLLVIYILPKETE